MRGHEAVAAHGRGQSVEAVVDVGPGRLDLRAVAFAHALDLLGDKCLHKLLTAHALHGLQRTVRESEVVVAELFVAAGGDDVAPGRAPRARLRAAQGGDLDELFGLERVQMAPDGGGGQPQVLGDLGGGDGTVGEHQREHPGTGGVILVRADRTAVRGR